MAPSAPPKVSTDTVGEIARRPVGLRIMVFVSHCESRSLCLQLLHPPNQGELRYRSPYPGDAQDSRHNVDSCGAAPSCSSRNARMVMLVQVAQSLLPRSLFNFTRKTRMMTVVTVRAPIAATLWIAAWIFASLVRMQSSAARAKEQLRLLGLLRGMKFSCHASCRA